MIRKNTSVTLLLLGILFIPGTASAAKSIEDCNKQLPNNKSMPPMSRCLDSVISYVDRELQTWVNLHSFNLEEQALSNGRYSALKMFKRSQNNFISYREDDCRWQYLAISPDKGAEIAYKTCYITLSHNRIQALSKVKSSKQSASNL